MDGDNNDVNNAATTPEKAEVIVPNLTNKKRFDCGGGRIAIVRCADEVTLGEIDSYVGGAANGHARKYHNLCAQWGIESLEGDWGNGPDGKPWKRVQGPLGSTYPVDIVRRLSPPVIGEISAYVNYGAYLTEVQGKD